VGFSLGIGGMITWQPLAYMIRFGSKNQALMFRWAKAVFDHLVY